MRTICAGSLLFILTGCGPATLTTSDPLRPVSWPTPSDSIKSGQAILVWPAGKDLYEARLAAWQRGGEGWSMVYGPMPAVIGPRGFAPPGEKCEGDGRTPSGCFRVGTAFGWDPTIETKLTYRQATDDDYWIDDPASPQYNRWANGKPDAKSFERLRQDDYKYAAVIEYNTDPVVSGKGIAIFLHVWEGPKKPTSGCVALEEMAVIELLKWLDKTKNPVIVLDPKSQSR